jgi:predicted DNA-binding transcriptional regulator YafY
MNKQIIEAIQTKRLLQFDYDHCRRVVEPHIFGVSTTGNTILSAYQTDGRSNSGKIPDWRTFDLSKIKNLKITDQTFQKPQPDYNPDDPHFARTFAKL